MNAVMELLTAEEFERLPDNGMQHALVRGKVVETMLPGAEHGGIVLTIGSSLLAWADNLKKGYTGVASGFVLARGPDTVRGPDVYYVRAERIFGTGVPQGFWQIAPDLAVEVVSPSETAQEVRDKVQDYLAAGTLLVWEVYPKRREVVVHTADGNARTLRGAAVLEDATVLPGFKCSVAELFA